MGCIMLLNTEDGLTLWGDFHSCTVALSSTTRLMGTSITQDVIGYCCQNSDLQKCLTKNLNVLSTNSMHIHIGKIIHHSEDSIITEQDILQYYFSLLALKIYASYSSHKRNWPHVFVCRYKVSNCPIKQTDLWQCWWRKNYVHHAKQHL